jgi:hypothetical protein
MKWQTELVDRLMGGFFIGADHRLSESDQA